MGTIFLVSNLFTKKWPKTRSDNTGDNNYYYYFNHVHRIPEEDIWENIEFLLADGRLLFLGRYNLFDL